MESYYADSPFMDATRLILFNNYMTVVEVGAHSLLYSWTSRDPETEIN